MNGVGMYIRVETGVSMLEIMDVIAGIETDILKRSAQKSLASQYFSLVCPDRTIDLFVSSAENRDTWVELIRTLAFKERGVMPGVPAEESQWQQQQQHSSCEQNPVDAGVSIGDDSEWAFLYSAIGKLPSSSSVSTK